MKQTHLKKKHNHITISKNNNLSHHFTLLLKALANKQSPKTRSIIKKKTRILRRMLRWRISQIRQQKRFKMMKWKFHLKLIAMMHQPKISFLLKSMQGKKYQLVPRKLKNKYSQLKIRLLMNQKWWMTFRRSIKHQTREFNKKLLLATQMQKFLMQMTQIIMQKKLLVNSKKDAKN